MRNIQPPVDIEKLFIGDIRETPRGVWMRAHTVEEAIDIIKENYDRLYLISFGRDVGDYNPPDYIKILDWVEEFYGPDFKLFFEIHFQDPANIANIHRIIEQNGWKEIG